jgi:hypothetical protein
MVLAGFAPRRQRREGITRHDQCREHALRSAPAPFAIDRGRRIGGVDAWGAAPVKIAHLETKYVVGDRERVWGGAGQRAKFLLQVRCK